MTRPVGAETVPVPLSALAALMDGHEALTDRIDRVEAVAIAASRVITALRAWRDTPRTTRDMLLSQQLEAAVMNALTDYEAIVDGEAMPLSWTSDE